MSVDEAIVAGLHRISPTDDGKPARVRVLASGPTVRSAQEASALLAARGIRAEVWSVTSWKRLRDDALGAERWNRSHPQRPRQSLLQRALSDSGTPVVAVSDYVSALPDTIARYSGVPFVSLGTDGYGLSDTREELRSHFGTDAAGIAAAAAGLVDEQPPTDHGLTTVPAQAGRQQQMVA